MTVRLNDVCQDLEEEIRLLLYGLTPAADESTKFKKHKGNTSFKEVTGKKRLFDIEWDVDSRSLTIGSNVRTWMAYANIMIGYPLHGSSLTMMSDVQQIADAINYDGGGSSVSNCSFRSIDKDSAVTIEEISGDWSIMTLRLKAAVETEE